MSDSKYKLNNAKDKVLGEVKEAVGKVTGNEDLELKGKIQ
ncbi:MAG: CsbD family protein, partial [Peptostreptococcaceae bacterium]|nr:CsbD family protein [Peptostreptococcaceae bacterium]